MERNRSQVGFVMGNYAFSKFLDDLLCGLEGYQCRIYELLVLIKKKNSTLRLTHSPGKDFTQKALFGVVNKTTFVDA